MPKCLFCIRGDVMNKPSGPDWDSKINYVGHPFFMEFNLHCEYWESFKRAQFCSECFARLEELQQLLRKINLLRSDVNQLKQIITLTVRRSKFLAAELTPNPENPGFLQDVQQIRRQLSLQLGLGLEQWSPEMLNGSTSSNTWHGNLSMKPASLVFSQSEAGDQQNTVSSCSQDSPVESRKRRRRRSSLSPSSPRDGSFKHPRFDSEEEDGPDSSAPMQNTVNNPDRKEGEHSKLDIALLNSIVNAAASSSSSELVDISIEEKESCLHRSEPVSEYAWMPAVVVEDENFLTQADGPFSSPIQEPEIPEPSQQVCGLTEAVPASPGPGIRETVTVTSPVSQAVSRNDPVNQSEVSPFRSTFKVQDSNESVNKEVSISSQEMWKSHKGLVQSSGSGVSSSEAESTFLEQIKPSHCSTVIEESILSSTGLETSNSNSESIAIPQSQAVSAVVLENRANADARSDNSDDVYYDSNEGVPDPENVSEQADSNVDSCVILEERSYTNQRRHRQRKWKRRYDPPQNMFVCSNRGCGTFWKAEELLQRHIDDAHNGEFQQNDCELCLLKHPEPFPLATSTPANNGNDEMETKMCHSHTTEDCTLKCDICPDKFLTINCKDYHQSRHRPRGSITFTRCTECDKNFDTPACLRNHLKLHNLNLDCIPCKESFSTLLALQTHNDTYHDPAYETNQYCRRQKKNAGAPRQLGSSAVRTFRNHEASDRPTTSHSRKTGNAIFQCMTCPKNFELEKYLFFHEQYCKKRRRK